MTALTTSQDTDSGQPRPVQRQPSPEELSSPRALGEGLLCLVGETHLGRSYEQPPPDECLAQLEIVLGTPRDDTGGVGDLNMADLATPRVVGVYWRGDPFALRHCVPTVF
jgi:hypothetical protein